MRCLLDTNLTPPGGFVYKQPETGYEFKFIAYHDFIEAIRKHRIGNNIEIGISLHAEIQNELCSKLDDNFCAECEIRVEEAEKIGVGDIVEKYIGKPVANIVFKATKGKVDIRNCSGCKKRKDWLNNNLPKLRK